MKIDLSIIIVSYNTKEMLLKCLGSLGSLGTLKTEIIVIDNGSEDGTVEAIKELRNLGELGDLRVIRNRENLGFAKANNQGIKRAQGKYILLLNSDTMLYPKTLVSMIQFMDTKPEVGVATCKVELADAKLDSACHRGFPTPWASLSYFLGLERLFPKSKFFGQYHQGFMDMNKPHEIDSPSGAFYLVRREIIKTVGLLDEDYFMYGEDLDWSYRIKQAGWKIMYCPEVKIIHYKKQSGRASEDKKLKQEIDRHFYETMEIFYKKHYMHKYPKLMTILVIGLIRMVRLVIRLVRSI